MRTISKVHSPQERQVMRMLGGRLTHRSRWRLVVCVSIVRTAVTRVLPLAGAAGWWVTLVCLLPGLTLYVAACLGLKYSGRERLSAGAASIAAAAALLVDACSGMTVLITLFTEGVGAQGTQLTLALVAAGMLLFCMKREGLERGIYFLRIPLLVLLALIAGGYLFSAKADHLFPVLGDGIPGVMAALKAGMGMSWVFLLPLLEKPVTDKRLIAPLPPVLMCIGAVLSLCLLIPHERLMQNVSLGDAMTQTVTMLQPGLRLACICLWLATLFLALGSACSLSARHILEPFGREFVFLPGALAVLLAVTQAFSTRVLWQTLGFVEPWLWTALAVGCVQSFIRRKSK